MEDPSIHEHSLTPGIAVLAWLILTSGCARSPSTTEPDSGPPSHPSVKSDRAVSENNSRGPARPPPSLASPEDLGDPDERLNVPDAIGVPVVDAGARSKEADRTRLRVCVSYGTDFDDIHGGEDWWITPDAREGRGIRIRITETGKAIGDDVYYGYASSETGCTPKLLVEPGKRFGVRAYSQARVSDPSRNYVYIHQPSGGHARYWIQLASDVPPGDLSYTWQNNSKYRDDVVNLAAVAGHALNKRYGGLDGHEFHVYAAPCRFDPNLTSCYEDDASALPKVTSTEALFISEGGRRRKFVIAHEIGHAVGAKQESPPAEPAIAAWKDPKCGEVGKTSHELTSKEHQSTAAKEGFAHFYAATIWNDRLQKDCAFAYYKPVDHDLDGTVTVDPWVSCEEGADLLTKKGCAEAGFGSEWDWMRFWWDLHTDANVSFVDIAEIWADADSQSWNPIDDPSKPNDNPYMRLRNAFRAKFPTDSTLHKSFDTYANFNGVNR